MILGWGQGEGVLNMDREEVWKKEMRVSRCFLLVTSKRKIKVERKWKKIKSELE